MIRIFATVAGAVSIGFGVWHFFVPKLYDWYRYIAEEATELVVAVRAINFFFSASLVLFGLIAIIFVWSSKVDVFSLRLILIANAILWLSRLVFQIVFPQGSAWPAVQYGMLAAFIMVFCLYTACLVLSLTEQIG